jgi:hypothetical protein
MSSFKPFKEVVLNLAQLAAVIAVTVLKKTKIFLEWGRGSGKSFILAYFMREMVIQMPRAAFGLVGETYQKILSKTLPSTKEGLAILGLYEGYDYVVGKNGAKIGFKEPIQTPNKWENVIHFSNGCIFHLISLDNPNSGRGLNLFAVLGDEASLFDHTKLFNNVKTTNRSKKEQFKKASLLGAEIYVSSTPLTKKGKWFTDSEKLAEKEPHKYAYIKASAYINKDNLREEWFEEMKKESPSEVIYRAEILNIRPDEILNGFYPQFNAKKHCYTKYNNDYLLQLTENYTSKSFNCNQDNDIEHSLPLRLSIDWGVFLSCTISQKLPIEYRTLKSMWVKQPKDEEDLINDFCDYYDSLPNKMLYLYYGHDGNQLVRKKSRETYGDAIAKHLRKRGWKVFDKSKRKPVARHNDKYILINTLLKRSSSKLPKITINEPNNQDLIISIERAEARDGKNGIEKIKKDERNPSMKQQHTTHLSDAWDIPIYDIYKDIIKQEEESWDMPLTTSN